VCCSVLQCVAVCCSVLQCVDLVTEVLYGLCYSVLQCVAALCCSALLQQCCSNAVLLSRLC